MVIIRNFFAKLMDEVSGENAGGGGAPSATPAAAPAAPAAYPAPAAPAATEVPAASAAEAAAAVPDTGRPGLNLFLNFLNTNGITPDHPAYQAADNGDFSMLRAELAAKGVSGADQMIALGEAESKAIEAESAQRTEQVKQVVLSVFDGDEGYQNSVLEWAKANAEPDEREAVNAMFAAGGIQAQAAALLLKNLHQQAGNTTPEKTALIPTAKPGAAPQGNLTQAEYAKAMAEGVRKFGAQFGRSAEAQALRARVK